MTNNHNTTNTAPRNPQGTTEQQYYAYFVSVLNFTDEGMGAAQFQLFRTLPITTMQDVDDVQQWVRTNNAGFEDASVIGYTLLRMVPASEIRGQR